LARAAPAPGADIGRLAPSGESSRPGTDARPDMPLVGAFAGGTETGFEE
jgi:hypothetical protein